MAPPREAVNASTLRKDPVCQALITALSGANKSVDHAIRLYNTGGVCHTINDLRKLRESTLITLCTSNGATEDEALCCARLILGPKSSATEETTLGGLLRGTFRSDMTTDRLSLAGHTLQSLKEMLQSRSFGREQLTALLSGIPGILDHARDGVVRLLMASAGRDSDAPETSSQPVVIATTAPTPVPPPSHPSDDALRAREQSRILLATRLLREEHGGRCPVTNLCNAIYAVDAQAKSHFANWFGSATRWFEAFPDVFSLKMAGATRMVSLATPAPPPQRSDEEGPPSLAARNRSLALLAASLLRDHFDGEARLTSLCDALYAADPEARGTIALSCRMSTNGSITSSALKWIAQFPDMFSCEVVGTTAMVSLATGDAIEEAATDDGQPPPEPTDGAAASSSGAAPSSGAAAPSSGQPESQVAFEEPITDISLEPTTGGASQMVFTAGGDILLPPSVIEDFGYTASDMVKASDVRPPS